MGAGWWCAGWRRSCASKLLWLLLQCAENPTSRNPEHQRNPHSNKTQNTNQTLHTNATLDPPDQEVDCCVNGAHEVTLQTFAGWGVVVRNHLWSNTTQRITMLSAYSSACICVAVFSNPRADPQDTK